MINYLKLLRIHQWIKNVFVLAVPVFGGIFLEPKIFITALGALCCFCLFSSFVYIINDIVDSERDRAHPLKSNRPLARGVITKGDALILASFLLLLATILSITISINLLVVGLIYIGLNIAYSFYLKNIPIIDVIVIALGFELRIVAGAIVCGIIPSDWLMMCTFLLALFLGLTKRKNEIFITADSSNLHREVLTYYRVNYLDKLILISATLSIISYMLYVISQSSHSPKPGLIYTSIFVIYGIFRYLYQVDVEKKGGDLARLLFKDLPSLVNLILWIISIFIILYFNHGN